MSNKKHILITGCSSGIGRYCAKALHVKDNYKVYATSRTKEDVQKLKNEGLWACRLDLNDSESIQDGLDEILAQSGGRLDILFNNGAYGQPGAVEDLSDEALKAQFQTNVFGTQELTNKVLKIMRQQNSGRIIYNSSILGFVAMAYRGAYNASKFAIEGLVDTLRLELVESNIKAILIEPGPIRSDFRKNSLQKFSENIDVENSFHHDFYKQTLKRLQKEGDSPFTLPPNAVYEALLKAMEDKNPKARYRVTKPTTWLWYLKKILPTPLLDKILIKAGK